MTTQGLKQTIRQRIISEREQLPAKLRAQFSTEIVRRIVQLPEYQAARVVLGYMNFGAEFESDIWIRQALADGKQLLLPKVNRVTNELDIYRVADLQLDLAPGMWNIREPLPDRCTKVNTQEEVDFILLPGVAFGREGARLGYGGGFYDKLLARFDDANRMEHRFVLVAGAYAMQLVEDIPQEETDRKVQWLVTENETINCAG
jgi:5-formyltetrahydrofolate cyclo-ligase